MNHSFTEASAVMAEKLGLTTSQFRLNPTTETFANLSRTTDRAVILVLQNGHHLVLLRQYLRRPLLPLNPPDDFSLQDLEAQYSGKCFTLTLTNSINALPPLQGFLATQFDYLKRLRSYWSDFFEVGINGIVINFVGLLLPLFTSLVYDKVIGNHITDTLWALVIGMVLFAFLEVMLRIVRTVTFEKIAADLDSMSGNRFWDRLMATSLSRLPAVGLMLSNFRALISAREFFSSQTLQVIADFPFLFLYLVVLALVGGAVAWVPLFFAISMVAGYALFHKPQHGYGNQLVKQNAYRMTLLSDILQGQEWLKKSRMANQFAALWRNSEANSIGLQSRFRFWQSIGGVWAGLHMTLCSVFVIAIGVYQVDNLQMTMGSLIAASLISSRFMSAMAGLSSVFARYDELRTAQKNMDAALRPEPVADNLLPPRLLKGDLRVHQLAWRFSDQYPHVFSGLDFQIAAGQKVAIVGRSGCGKSTLLRCFNGLLTPSSGEVMWDGAKVGGHALETIERSIGYKAQDLFLFDGSLEENVSTALAVEASVDHAFEISGLNDAIQRGELSRDTMINNAGINLSGGQRQMVCIARALAHHPPIVLLDEPSNGLDEISEKRMLDRLFDYVRNKTLIVSTHSRFVLERVERVIVVDGGRIVADAPPQKILGG